MPRKQYRRSFSASKQAYEATRKLARERQVTTSHLVELALLAYGVVFEPGSHQTLEIASASAEGKLWASASTPEQRADVRRAKDRARYRAKVLAAGRVVRRYDAVRLVDGPGAAVEPVTQLVRIDRPLGAADRRAVAKTAEARKPAQPYRPSLERQMLGDGIANALGFR